ncbi:MAG: VOC family protein [Patescibacteria group bacterium]|nr:VOC family protein [Patescibacteria group bacterium]
MQKITPCLWFDTNAEEAMNFYTSIFRDSKILLIKRYPEGATEGPMAGMGGKVLTGIFELQGQRFMALDGGPIFKFSEAISFQIECEDQEEVDYFWSKLSAVSEAEQCGWVKDKFGLSWQIIPRQLGEMLSDADPEKANRTLEAMLKMKKIDIAALQAAYKGT